MLNNNKQVKFSDSVGIYFVILKESGQLSLKATGQFVERFMSAKTSFTHRIDFG